jgi:hypothetical protein
MEFAASRAPDSTRCTSNDGAGINGHTASGRHGGADSEGVWGVVGAETGYEFAGWWFLLCLAGGLVRENCGRIAVE